MFLLLSACTLFTDDLRDARWAELTADTSVPDDSAPSPDADSDGWTVADGDCNDDDPAINPAATEVCDHADNDCDDLTDEDPYPVERFPDNDGDGYGNGRTGSFACFPGDGWVENGDDCNDVNPDINPGASESCNGADDDCDEYVDEELATWDWWYADADGDGYGSDLGINDCVPPGDGWVTVRGDCDDTRPEVNEGAPEVCGNGLDDDCDGERECGWLGELEIEAEASARVLGDTEQGTLGGYLTSLGDADGDGVDELALEGGASTTSTMYIFRGGLAGDRTPAAANTGLTGTDAYLSNIAYSTELEAYLVCDGDYNRYAGAVYELPLSTTGLVDTANLDPRWEGADGTMDSVGYGLSVATNLYGDSAETILLPAVLRSITVGYEGEVLLLKTDGEEVARIQGTTYYEGFGGDPQGLADLDGDGLDEVGANGNHLGYEVSAEVQYSIFVSPLSGTVSREDSDAHFEGGEDFYFSLDCVESADLTGDGHNDLVLGSPNPTGDQGEVYILPGPLSSAWAGGHPDDVADRIELHETMVPSFGQSLATADFDADGTADIAVGSPKHGYRGNDDGGVFVVYGPLSGGSWSMASPYIDKAELHGVAAADYQLGYDIAALNVNGDEFPDLAISSVFADVGSLNNAGTTWIMLGDGI